MIIPDLSNGPPKCPGCNERDGWIGTQIGFLCADCLNKYNIHKQKKLVEEFAEAFK